MPDTEDGPPRLTATARCNRLAKTATFDITDSVLGLSVGELAGLAACGFWQDVDGSFLMEELQSAADGGKEPEAEEFLDLMSRLVAGGVEARWHVAVEEGDFEAWLRAYGEWSRKPAHA